MRDTPVRPRARAAARTPHQYAAALHSAPLIGPLLRAREPSAPRAKVPQLGLFLPVTRTRELFKCATHAPHWWIRIAAVTTAAQHDHLRPCRRRRVVPLETEMRPFGMARAASVCSATLVFFLEITLAVFPLGPLVVRRRSRHGAIIPPLATPRRAPAKKNVPRGRAVRTQGVMDLHIHFY